jgi:hypothetical protein
MEATQQNPLAQQLLGMLYGTGPFMPQSAGMSPQQRQTIPKPPRLGTLEYLDWERKYGPQYRASQRSGQDLESQLLRSQPQQLSGWRAYNPFDQAAASMQQE